MSEVICLKLTTGEDIIARVQEGQMVSDSPKEYLLEDVHVISLQQVGPGQVGMSLIPYLLGDHTAKIAINGAHVITAYPPAGQIRDGYLEKTSTIKIARAVPDTKIKLS